MESPQSEVAVDEREDHPKHPANRITIPPFADPLNRVPANKWNVDAPQIAGASNALPARSLLPTGPVDDWGKLLGDTAGGQRHARRLLHHGPCLISAAPAAGAPRQLWSNPPKVLNKSP